MLNRKDENYNQIIERFIDQLKEPFIIQKFLPEIKHGDKRIILVNGEPIAALRRIPKTNEIRSNIHVGGNCEAVKISKQDLNISKSEFFKIGDDSSKSLIIFDKDLLNLIIVSNMNCNDTI